MESRIATMTEYDEAQAAITAYIAAVIKQVRDAYVGFDGWPEEARASALITTAVQWLLRPEAFGFRELDMGVAMFSAGMGLGTQTQQVTEDEIHNVLRRLASGFCRGREQAFAAMVNMPTVGSA